MIAMLDPKMFTTFVTGATSGIGEATCRRFARARTHKVGGVDVCFSPNSGAKPDIPETTRWGQVRVRGAGLLRRRNRVFVLSSEDEPSLRALEHQFEDQTA